MTADDLQARILALESTDLLTLISHRELLPLGATLEEVYRLFKEHPYEFVGITGPDGRYAGVVSRGKVGFVLGSRYGFSLFNRDPVERHSLAGQLHVAADTPLLEVLDRALAREGEEFHHDVALVDAARAYRGMVTVRSLVLLQSELTVLQARLAEFQRQRLRGEAELRQSEERLRLALEAGQMAVWQIDVASEAITWNETGKAGWRGGTLPGSVAALTRIVHPDDRAALQAALRACHAEGTHYHQLFRCRQEVPPEEKAAGGVEHWRWIESRGHANLDEHGRALTITGLSIDVTARRMDEEALHAAKEEAERANAAKNEFLSRVSHELRTPLNAILGFGQLLELEELTTRQTQSVGYILKGGRHLLALIDEVLDITRIESGNIELALETVDARLLLDEVLSLVRPLAFPRRVVLHPPRCRSENCLVTSDRQRLKQVLLNLLSNAIKYNVEGGEVHTICEGVDDSGRVCVRVRDTGRGIAQELLPRLFQPFERLGVETGKIEGTGIGLAISKGLVEAMHGQLTAESVPGEGSVFTVALAAAPCPIGEHAALTTVDFRHPAEMGLESSPLATVLQIEDNADNTRLVEDLLACRQSGVRLLNAAQGRLGLELAREHRPELILLDLHLPDLPGEDVLRRLRDDARTRDIPVVVLSADATPRQPGRLLGLGASYYLTKPLDVARFLRTVEDVLAAGSEARRLQAVY